MTFTGSVRDRKAALDALGSPARPKTRQKLEEERVRVAGSGFAVVTGVNVVSSEEPLFTVRVRFTDVFVRSNGVWKAFSAQETLEKGD